MRRLGSILFWIFFAVTSVLAFAVAVAIWIITTPFDRKRRANHLFSCYWAYAYVLANPGWRVVVTGREKILPGHAHVIVANHTSVADIVLCYALFRQFKWVSKSSVFLLPFVGWNMYLCRYVSLVRGNSESVRRMMDSCRRWLRDGISIMMFPEGTRSPDGQLLRFKLGSFQLALETSAPVVPVAIHGGHALIPKHGKTLAARADLKVEVLDPIPPDGFAGSEAYAEAVRSRIHDALQAAGSLPA